MARFTFVYDADSGVLNILADVVRRVVSPQTYPCRLCELTYGATGMNRRWAAYVKTLPGTVRFLHRDEMAGEHPGLALDLPSLYEDSGTPRLVVTSWEMRAARDLDALIAAVDQRVRAAS